MAEIAKDSCLSPKFILIITRFLLQIAKNSSKKPPPSKRQKKRKSTTPSLVKNGVAVVAVVAAVVDVTVRKSRQKSAQ
jgi:hypothetical protein